MVLQHKAWSGSQQNGQNIPWAGTTGRGQQRKLGYSLARAILGVGRKSPCSQYGMNGRNGVRDARSVRGLCIWVQTRHLGLQPRGALEVL